MPSPVKLYVYDLSNGLAKQLSLQLTGKQIDGVWHTSVVVFEQEIFYGQGINTCAPGRSHHGQPLHIVDMGETALDQDTFMEYINEVKEHYTADKYHLLDFNCNSFTNDCVGFLTGGSIPSWIKDLPADFLSTPFGAAMRPTIDAMFRRPTPGQAPTPVPSGGDTDITSALLEAVAARAAGASSSLPPVHQRASASGSATVAGTMQVCTNPQSLQHILSAHRAVTLFFTSQTCMPCKMIEPVFERLAEEKASSGVAFAKVDMGVGMGSAVAGMFGVRATPTFIFFLDKQKTHELKGGDPAELKTQVDLLIHEAYPPHPHVKLNLPTIRALSTNPILFSQPPALDTVQTKLTSFIDAAPSSSLDGTRKSSTKQALSTAVFPFLKMRFATTGKVAQNGTASTYTQSFCTQFAQVTASMIGALPLSELFPVVDLWRLSVLDEHVSTWCAGTFASGSSNPILLLLERAAQAIDNDNGGTAAVPRSFLLTILRLFSNCFSNVTLARSLLDPQHHSLATNGTTANAPPRTQFTAVLISSLLHADALVRTAAASVTFNIAAHIQKPLFEAQRSGRRGDSNVGSEGDGDWEVEMVSAIIEALRTETESEDVVHRLTASLAFFLHLSPFYDTQLMPLLEVLQAKQVALAKLKGGEEGCGKAGVTKPDVKKLLQEVAEGLCP